MPYALLREGALCWEGHSTHTAGLKATGHTSTTACPVPEPWPASLPQGDADNFLAQLLPQSLEAAAADSGYPLVLRMQPGYDHSYFFISSFIDEHIEFHAKELKK